MTIHEAINSVSGQDYNNIEHVIVDGASADDTVTVIKGCQSRVSCLITEPDDGIYDALNKGIAIATGDVIGFLHSDDLFFDENVLSVVMDAFDKYQCDIVYGDLVYVSKHNPENIVRFWKSGDFRRWKMFFGWMPPHPAFFMRRELYLKYGTFDVGFKISSDYERCYRDWET